MGDDVIERGFVEFCFAQVGADERCILQAERLRPLLRGRDLFRGIVHPDELRLSEPVGHGKKVATRGTADFEHSTTVQSRRVESEQRGYGRQMVWMGLCVRQRRVRHRVVWVYTLRAFPRYPAAPAVPLRLRPKESLLVGDGLAGPSDQAAVVAVELLNKHALKRRLEVPQDPLLGLMVDPQFV